MASLTKASSSTNLTYPRTGKRGVPQQFPRRLYEMLEAETISSSSLIGANKIKEATPIIEWSESGRAFRIGDISLFATKILPKYFRTSKFSSFQRNLNLVSKMKSIRLVEEKRNLPPHICIQAPLFACLQFSMDLQK